MGQSKRSSRSPNEKSLKVWTRNSMFFINSGLVFFCNISQLKETKTEWVTFGAKPSSSLLEAVLVYILHPKQFDKRGGSRHTSDELHGWIFIWQRPAGRTLMSRILNLVNMMILDMLALMRETHACIPDDWVAIIALSCEGWIFPISCIITLI